MSKLYIVPTPIGNLKDITLRALETLELVDTIAAEDTRQTIKLLNHYNIKKNLISYHQHNEMGKSDEIIKRISMGENIALVSDAGSPGISDPGSVIIRKCIEEGVEFEVLPGATAIITALVASGLDTTKFSFRGFLPRETKDRRELVEEIKEYRDTLIFYEAPHRLLETLKFLRESFGNREISACKELTKLHETFVRGKLEDVIEYFSSNNIKGEFVLVLSGKSDQELVEEAKAKWENLTIEEHIIKFIDEGLDKKEAIKKVAKERGLSKSEVYKYGVGI
ncbi:16S rRNA (cytidine(1402)-2'-O)-methyltransferase [Clostridium sp. 'White wine YQ']|uniref:16S rRNA (cytidine(1402)-2'-O)-methyltransferase n=1 Tax=Clostridium sp. 'White wine YQ' TaxID=3027474 RepID=UPI0023673D2E|nr:16S rRNA (cytidine(1402)-2'-O)-methyltransferase [Clostridium sp. 'White wine YQ']MDD7795721.1 16S rRNA (cytidine(1402)-2'-O)-methyltransferase [Clostridium sp. 'White wine YQ']